jgi:hypothetical protein
LSFKGIDATGSALRLIAMFHGSPEDPFLSFDAHAMRSLEPEGERLIETMKRVLQEVTITIYLDAPAGAFV